MIGNSKEKPQETRHDVWMYGAILTVESGACLRLCRSE
jgi:hypothetical protein